MKKLDHLVHLISQPWAIRPEVIEGWCQILDARLSGQDLPQELAAIGTGRAASGDEPFTRDGNVAIVPMVGTLVKRNSFFSCDSTYPQLRQAVAAAAAAKGIDAVMLDGDTPGGTVAGVQETADYLAKVDQQKPLYGWVDDLAASAGYWLISQARQIGAHAGADVGSIGVIGMHYDRSGQDAQRGIKRTVMAVGDLKAAGNDTGPMTAEEHAYMMDRLNQAYGMFIGAVNKGRPAMSADHIRSMQSRVYKGAEAQKMGLVDHVMGREEFINHVKRQTKGAVSVPVKGARAMNLETLRAEHPDLVAQIETAARVGMIAQAEHDTALAAARSETGASARTGLLALHEAVFGAEANQRFAAIVESGVSAAQATALGVTAATGNGDQASRQQILQALQGASSNGLRPGQVHNPAKAGVDTAGIYAARATKP
jgi:capsid assembly protease